MPAEARSAIADIQSRHRAWYRRKGFGWLRTQRKQLDSDGLKTRKIRVEIRKGQPIHLVAGDLGDGNKGDWVLFKQLQVHSINCSMMAPAENVIKAYLTWSLKTQRACERE